MMYHQKFVAVVKVNGRILREFDNNSSESSVLLPFGSQYSILAKNLESRPARLKVWIDGEDVLSGNGIIVPAGKEIELDGFMNTNGRVTNRFKFIQKTEQIIDHRGDRIDDGLIRIEWQYEKQQPIKVDVYENHYYNGWHWYHPKPYWPSDPWITYGSGTIRGFSGDIQVSNCVNLTSSSKNVPHTNTCSIDMPMAAPTPDEGITVKGQELDQQYRSGYIGALEPNKYVMIIRLKGTAEVAGEKVVAPVEVKTKIQCPTCGTMTKSGTKYCSDCGTCVVEI
jgi:hypothetical protein